MQRQVCYWQVSHIAFSQGYASAGSTPSAASLPCAALRLTAALIGAHGKDVGASGGLEVIREMAPSWGPLLQQAPVIDVRMSANLTLHHNDPAMRIMGVPYCPSGQRVYCVVSSSLAMYPSLHAAAKQRRQHLPKDCTFCV